MSREDENLQFYRGWGGCWKNSQTFWTPGRKGPTSSQSEDAMCDNSLRLLRFSGFLPGSLLPGLRLPDGLQQDFEASLGASDGFHLLRRLSKKSKIMFLGNSRLVKSTTYVSEKTWFQVFSTESRSTPIFLENPLRFQFLSYLSLRTRTTLCSIY